MLRDLDVLPCGLLQTLEDGTIRQVNQTFCAWLEKPPEVLIGKRFQDLLTVGGKIFHHTHWAPLLRMQGSISEVKLELVHAGSVLPVVINAVRRDEEGVIVHELAIYVARDRDRYEQELVRARKRLEDAVAELNQLHAAARERAAFAELMIGIVSHDLRNPLSAIQLGTELLACSPLAEDDQRTLQRIGRAAKRATRLVADLLDLTRVRAGKGIAITRAPLHLHEVVAESLDELRLAHPGVVIEHLREGEGECLGDAGRIAQLLGNLVSNAIAYGAPTAPISVATRAGDRSVLSVHNLGRAIPAELQPLLFEPMTRGGEGNGEGNGERGRSVGLGLFIVREIARAHGGDASVVSSEKDGTVFRVEW